MLPNSKFNPRKKCLEFDVLKYIQRFVEKESFAKQLTITTTACFIPDAVNSHAVHFFLHSPFFRFMFFFFQMPLSPN